MSHHGGVSDDFPSNPFRSNDDANDDEPNAGVASGVPSPDDFVPAYEVPSAPTTTTTTTNAPPVARTAPPSEPTMSSFDADPHGTSFEPVGVPGGGSEEAFVGSGAIDAPTSPSSSSFAKSSSFGSGAGGGAGDVSSRTWIQTFASCFNLESHRVYFDVDTKDVVNRMIGTVKLCNEPDGYRTKLLGVGGGEEEGGGRGPDLYGPFWIVLTLVFFVAVTSNMSSYLHASNMEEFEYDLSNLIRACTILGFFAFGTPSVLFVVLRCLAIPNLSLVELVALYGYSVVTYLPATILCLVPSEFVVWIGLLIPTASSCLLVLRNVAGPILEADTTQNKKAGPVLMSIIASHLIFFVVLKLVFYHHR